MYFSFGISIVTPINVSCVCTGIVDLLVSLQKIVSEVILSAIVFWFWTKSEFASAVFEVLFLK